MADHGTAATVKPRMFSTLEFPTGQTPLEVRVPTALLGKACSAAFTMDGATKAGQQVYLNFGASFRVADGIRPGAVSLQEAAKDDPRAAAMIERIGASVNSQPIDVRGRNDSFVRSFTMSAIGVNTPNGPTRFGP